MPIPDRRLCGAKTRSGETPGAPCKDLAMPNGRCKRHGGKATGAKNPNTAPGTKASTKFGIYSQFLTPEDRDIYDAAELGSVDSELRLVRLRLARTVKARRDWEESVRAKTAALETAAAPVEDHLVLVEAVDDQSLSKDGDVYDLEKRIHRLPDFDKIEQACLARIESLEKTRKELLKEGGGGDGDDVPGKDRVTFSGGLDGGDDDDLPSPFKA